MGIRKISHAELLRWKERRARELGPEEPQSIPLIGRQGPRLLDEVVLAHVRCALEYLGGDVSKAARQLGVSRSTFYRRYIEEPPS